MSKLPLEGGDFEYPLAVKTLAFSPDGRFLASGGISGGTDWTTNEGLRVFDVDSGTAQDFHHFSSVLSVAFSPDGTTLASLGDTLKLFDVVKGEELSNLPLHIHAVDGFGHLHGVDKIAIKSDGTSLAYSCHDQTFFSDVKSGTIESVIKVNASFGLEFSADGQSLAVIPAFGFQFLLFDTKTGELKATLKGHTVSLYFVSWSADNAWMITGGQETPLPEERSGVSPVNSSSIRIWDAQSLTEIAVFRTGFYGGRMAVLSPNRKLLAAATGAFDNNDTTVWNLETNQRIFHVKGYPIVFTPDGTRLISANKNSICLWEMTNGKKVQTFPTRLLEQEGMQYPSAYQLARSGSIIAIGYYDGIIELYNIDEAQLVLQIPGHTASVSGLGFTPTDTMLISGSSDGTIAYWGIPN